MTIEEIQNQTAKTIRQAMSTHYCIHTWDTDPFGGPICKANQFYINLGGLDHLITVEAQDPR
jgi:hypothetical protein